MPLFAGVLLGDTPQIPAANCAIPMQRAPQMTQKASQVLCSCRYALIETAKTTETAEAAETAETAETVTLRTKYSTKIYKL